MPTAMNGATRQTVVSVHSHPWRAIERGLARGRQWTAASSGSEPAPGAAGMDVLAPGDRPAQDHRRRLERQLPDLLGVAGSAGDNGVVALVELLSERGHCGLDARRIPGCPLRQR